MLSLHEQIVNCTNCPLHKLMPYDCKPVPGIGPVDAGLMLVGEALGENEVLQSQPFVGACGKYLDKMMFTAGFDRKSVYICNTVNCRPVDGKKNRPPTEEEIDACKPWLWKQIQLVQPKVIVTLGKIPTCLLLKKKNLTLKNILGVTHNIDYCNAKVIPCYHPSYLMVHNKNATATCVKILEKAKELSV